MTTIVIDILNLKEIKYCRTFSVFFFAKSDLYFVLLLID